MKEPCTNCEAMKILLYFQWNLKKANNTEEVKEALDCALKGKSYFNCGE
jgi:hypothetical protein